MFISERLSLLVLLPLLFCTARLAGRQSSSAAHPGDKIYLDVVVTPEAGSPVSGLPQRDFTILDNGTPQTIASFEALDSRKTRIEVVVVLDAVNVGSREAAITREEIEKFLRADGGHLVCPTAVAVLTEKGLQFWDDFSQNGNAISSALDQYKIPLRSGTTDRFQISFQGFARLMANERGRPGRKIVIWVSPGWPKLPGPGAHDFKKRQQVFGNIVEVSTQLREGQIKLYSIDPSALEDIGPGLTNPPTIHLRPSGQKTKFVGVSEPGKAQLANLTLEEIATQSGGLTLHPGNNMTSELRKCLADTTAFYEISFDPTITDQLNAYHQLEVHLTQPGLTARAIQGYYSQPWRPDNRTDSPEPDMSSPASIDITQRDDANTQFIDLPTAQLVERIPELKALRPAPNQEELPMILQNVGRRVDDFARAVSDLIADEDVIQEKLNAQGKTAAKEHVQDSYLILHHGYEWGANAEYRMDDKGNRLGPIGLARGYLVTAGHALSCITFSTAVQPQSKFRYLGEEEIDSRETYVVGFAQQPGEATFFTTMRGTGGADVDLLTQGILWLDKGSFQIIRMRTDLLAPNKEIRLDRLTTGVKFQEVLLQDVSNPLWLPKDVDVYIEINGQKFHNLHHYTNYRRYRVSVKIASPH
jgi:VWFA-related protein